MWLFKLKFPQGKIRVFPRFAADEHGELPPPRSPHGAAGGASPAPLPVGAAGAQRAGLGWAAEASGHQ